MIQFRASSAGNCTRQIVLKQLEPDRYLVDKAKRPFLDAGHYLQEHVEAFIQEEIGVLDLDRREEEGVYTAPFFTIVGHIDGMLDTGDLLEVKAIKAASYEKLDKTYDWREQYGHYQPQAQVYQKMFDAPGSHFVYYNRNTSEMMGSLDIDHPAYTFRKDMYEPNDGAIWNGILQKYLNAVRHIEDSDPPAECDAKGYCFFCGVRGSEVPKSRAKKVSLFPDDDEYEQLMTAATELDDARFEVNQLFNEWNATEIHAHHGTKNVSIFRKEDYEKP